MLRNLSFGLSVSSSAFFSLSNSSPIRSVIFRSSFPSLLFVPSFYRPAFPGPAFSFAPKYVDFEFTGGVNSYMGRSRRGKGRRRDEKGKKRGDWKIGEDGIWCGNKTPW